MELNSREQPVTVWTVLHCLTAQHGGSLAGSHDSYGDRHYRPARQKSEISEGRGGQQKPKSSHVFPISYIKFVNHPTWSVTVKVKVQKARVSTH